tara:strand:+ start:1389 stop:1829 length:441 start_codon:yes stop_codon:yes gene_type:complete
MSYSTNPIYKLIKNPDGVVDIIQTQEDDSEPIKLIIIPLCQENRHYQEYLEDIKTFGMSIVTCTDCGDGVPNGSMWQYLDNAEQLLTDKYGSDPSLHDKMTALREVRYVRAMEAKTPYESMKVAGPVIDATPQEIKDKHRHLPMRR